MKTKTKAPAPAPEPTEAQIQHVAYLLWLENGQKPDHDLENWLAAKEYLRHHGAPGKAGRHLANAIPPAIPTAAAAAAS